MNMKTNKNKSNNYLEMINQFTGKSPRNLVS